MADRPEDQSLVGAPSPASDSAKSQFDHLDELIRLRSEVQALRAEIAQLRSSKWFMLRERLLPHDSFLRRLYFGLRTGRGLKSISPQATTYTKWCESWDTVDNAGGVSLRKRKDNLRVKPTFSVIMPVYNPPEEFLIAAIESVRRQIYPHWEMCIADDASTEPYVRQILERFSKEDSRIKVAFRATNGHISATANDALALAKNEYVGFLDHDDTLAEDALLQVAYALDQNPDLKFIYSDEDKLDDRNRRTKPSFKPDWDPLLLLSVNYTNHFSVYKTDLGKSIGWLRQGFEGAQDWDFVLRFTEKILIREIAHIPHVLYHWRIHPESTAQAVNAKSYVPEAQLKSVREALERRGITGSCQIDGRHLVRTFYEIPPLPPRVSILIPTRDRVDLLSKCVSSILSLTAYPNFEVIVIDNGSTDSATLAYLEDLSSRPNVQVLRIEAPFNFSALNNRAVEKATGEIVALVNNDLEITEESWLYRLTAYALQDGVGAVGPRLLYPNGQVQHGGVIVGYLEVAGHAHHGIGKDDPGYQRLAVADHSVSAITGACLIVKKDRYLEVGGLDEEFAVAFNDIDFCLKLGQIGLRNIYAGTVTCTHHESQSRGQDSTPEKRARVTTEGLLFKSRWREKLSADPYYNPNLTLDGKAYELAEQPRVSRFDKDAGVA